MSEPWNNSNLPSQKNHRESKVEATSQVRKAGSLNDSGEIQVEANEVTSDNVSVFKGLAGSNDGDSLFGFGGNPSFRQKVQQRKDKNLNNMTLQKFRKLIQRKDAGTEAHRVEVLKMLPVNLENDPYEALLYLYFCVRYYDEHIFKVILKLTSNLMGISSDVQSLVRDARSYHRLIIDESYDRFKLNQSVFETALEKDYIDVAFHFIEHGYVHITWEMVRKMLQNRQEYLVKQCIKYQCKFDSGSAQIKKVVFAGRTAQPIEDRTIRLVDFIQIMLELKWKSGQIIWVLSNYSKKGKIDSIDLRELFLMFAMKRKLKLMSHLINSDDFSFDFTEDNFCDVLENDVYDMGVLLYREYFLHISRQKEKITQLLVRSFQKPNGQLESKCYLLQRFVSSMNFDQATLFVDAIEERIKDSSRGNLLVQSLNVVKTSCLLIELLNKVKFQFSFMQRKINEVITQIMRIVVQYMNEVQSEDEMRFLLLEKDLDNRDALNIIYENDLAELIEHPYAQNIVHQIWTSPYNNSSSMFSASSVHTLLFNYNHCRFDLENSLRFYKKRNLQSMDCHSFQFQIWRFAAESRYFIQALCVWVFVILVQIHMTNHMSMSLYLRENQTEINYALDVQKNPLNFPNLTPDQIALQNRYADNFSQNIMEFYRSANIFIIIFYFQWMFVFQQFYQAMYAGRNKRVMKYFQFENLLDTVILFTDMAWLIIHLRKYRYGTFLVKRAYRDEAIWFYYQYFQANVNENVLLFIIGTLLWIKAFHQLSFLEITGSLYQVVVKMLRELIKFGFFYVSVIVIYAIIGVVLFSDLDAFNDMPTALFTLFTATLKDYNIGVMTGCAVGNIIGYIYFNSYLIVNVILLVNLLIAQFANAYRKHNKKRKVLMLLYTLSVRDVSEADEKYSSVVSAPFPLSVCNLLFGSIVLGAKSPTLNLILLHFYFLPVLIVCVVVFILYQIAILPFCYIKMLGHKWALIVKAPVGKGSSSSLDRAGQFFIFLIFGLPLLFLDIIVDTYWYIAHTYKTDLDRSNSSKAFIGNDQLKNVEIHRRTYKKMLKYFETQNDQLVLQKTVAEDLRKYLDVEEGLRCQIWGKPDQIATDKIALYLTYAKQRSETDESQDNQKAERVKTESNDDKSTNDEFFSVERVVKEYTTLKQVLINNAIPVDLAEIETGGAIHGVEKNTKGWGMRVLFDKKVFLTLLHELENMRKILQVKKMYYIFHLPYEGKPKRMGDWHKKVAHRTTQTLKFMHSARLLRIIKYDPTQFIYTKKFSAGRGEKIQQIIRQPSFSNKKFSIKREEEQGETMLDLIQKYTSIGAMFRQIAQVVKDLNSQSIKRKQLIKKSVQKSMSQRQNEMSPEAALKTFEKQKRMNASKPTASGVISSPDPDHQTAIQRIEILGKNLVGQTISAAQQAAELGRTGLKVLNDLAAPQSTQKDIEPYDNNSIELRHLNMPGPESVQKSMFKINRRNSDSDENLTLSDANFESQEKPPRQSVRDIPAGHEYSRAPQVNYTERY